MAAPSQQQPQQMMDHGREPCPDRILDDIGGAFAMGAVGGGAWHLIKGMRNSPPGFRVRGALESLRRESPRMGGSFANWGLAFSCFDCSLQYIRKKEDPWNAIWAGALTGGFLQLRHGLRSAAQSAAFGGFLLALIEGVSISLNKMTSPPPPGVPYQPPMGAAPAGAGPPPPGADMGAAPGAPSTSGSSGGFWSFFGGGEQAAPKEQSFNEDSFAPPPVPEFNASGGGTDAGFK